MSEVDKYVRVPFKDPNDARAIKDELSPQEMANALVRAYNESVEGDDPDDPTDIESYDTLKEVEEARESGLIDEKTFEQLKIKGRRRGLTRF